MGALLRIVRTRATKKQLSEKTHTACLQTKSLADTLGACESNTSSSARTGTADPATN